MRVVCELDLSHVVDYDAYGNAIYDYKLDGNGDRIYHVFYNDNDYYEWINETNRWNFYNLRRGTYASDN